MEGPWNDFKEESGPWEDFQEEPVGAIVSEPSSTDLPFGIKKEIGEIPSARKRQALEIGSVKDYVDFLSSPIGILAKSDKEQALEESIARMRGPVEKRDIGPVLGAIAGISEGGRDIFESFKSPIGLATLGTGALPTTAQKIVSGVFAADMARHVPELATESGRLSVEGTTQEQTRAGTALLGTTAFATLAGSHSLPRSKAELVKAGEVINEATYNLRRKAGFARTPLETLQKGAPEVPLEGDLPLAQAPTASNLNLGVYEPVAERIRVGADPELTVTQEAFSFRDPSGLRMASERAVFPSEGAIKATPEMLEVMPGLQSQARTGMAVGPEAIRPSFQPEPSSVIEPTRRVSAMGREQTVAGPSGETIVPAEPQSKFLVDERGVAIKLADKNNPTTAEIARIKSVSALPENAIPLTERAGEQFNNTIFIDETGNARIGAMTDVPEPRRLTMTPIERLELERSMDAQVQEALDIQSKLAQRPAVTTPKAIDKALPTRETISPEESQQIATQFQQRVPSEQARGQTEFNRPADPQIGAPEPKPITTPWTLEEYMGNFEKWADNVISESRGRSYTGLDPQLLAAYTVKGAALLARGVVNAGEWSAAMIKEYGRDIRPYLVSIRKQSEQARSKYFSEPKEPNATQAKETPSGSSATPNIKVPEAEPTEVATQKTFTQKVKEYFKQQTPEGPTNIRIDKENVLPRLQPYEASKRIASQPQGLSKIPVLGRVLDPRYSASSPVDKAIIARARDAQTGDSIAAMWGTEQQKFKDVFKVGDDGMFQGKSGRHFMEDTIKKELERPGSQDLTEAQRKWVNEEWVPVWKDANRMLREEGVNKVTMEDGSVLEVDKPYFPRNAIGKKGIDAGASGSRKPGSKQFFQRERLFPTEEAGVKSKQQMIYDPSHVSRVSKFISGVYRSIADHRIANDVSLGGQSLKDLRKTLSPEDARELDTNIQESAHHPIWLKEGTVNAPAFAGKVFPADVVKKLNKAYGETVPDWIKKAESANVLSKATMLTLDASAPLNQGLGFLTRYPIRWAKATAKHFQAMLDPLTMTKMLEQPKYKNAATEFIQSGGTLFRLQDFMEGSSSGATATKIPLLGKAVEATGRGFGTFMDMAKLEMWDARSKVTERSKWSELAESIENSLMIGRMENIGISPSRAVGERLIALAPTYYRGGASLVASALQKGVSGKLAREMIISYMAGGLALTVAAWKALGLSNEEIVKRLDPSSGKFLKVPVPIGENKKFEVGAGGLILSFVRLLGESAEYFNSDKPIDTGVEGNPIVKWTFGKAAFWPGLAKDIVLGKDFNDNRLPIWEATIRRFTPLVLQQMFPNEPKEWDQKAAGMATSFIGIQGYPQSDYASYGEKLSKKSEEMFSKPLSSLSAQERFRVVKSVEEPKNLPSPQVIERAIANSAERRTKIRKGLSEESKIKIDMIGQAPTYKSKLRYNGQDIPLSEKESDLYQKLITQELEMTLQKIDLDYLSNLDEKKSAIISKKIELAKEKATQAVLKQMGKVSP